MRNIIFALILAAYGVGFATTGDIKSVTIDSTGWRAEVVIEGFSPLGTYALGIDTSDANNPLNAKCLFIVTRKGFNANAQATTMLDTVVATIALRKPYPDHATTWEDANGGNVRVRLVLSEYIHTEDVVQCNLASGWYTDAGAGGTVNAVTGYSVTNTSTEGYITPVGNWSYPDRILISNNSIEPHCFVVHRSGRNARPVACVIFTATDGASNTVRDTVLIPSVSSSMPDAVPVCEYWTSMDVSSLNDGDITLNFKAYPWVGEALLSSDDTNIGAVNKLLKNQSYYKSSSYGRTFAFVDVAGNNGTGTASADSATAFAAPFADIGSAIDACESFNNTTYGRNNPDNSVVYLTAGVHEAEGTPIYVSNTNAKVWTEIKGYPAHNKEDIIIVPDSDRWGTFTSKYTRLSHVTLRQESDTWVIADINSSLDLWLDKVSIDGYGAAASKWAVYAYKNLYITHSDADSSLNIDADIVRGNTVTNMKRLSQATMIVGNTMFQRPGEKFAVINKVNDNAVIAYNTCYRLTYAWLSHASTDINYGLAVVGNLVEQISEGASDAMITLGTKDISIRNLIMWNNTFTGQRYLGGYTTTNGLEEYTLSSHKNSIYYYFANKTDLFYHNTDGLGGWPIGFGVGCSGNAMRNQPYNQEFAGLNCAYGSNTGNIFGFVDDQGTLGGNNGFGDYSMDGTGLGIALSKDLTMPLDICGNPFQVNGATGAYENGSVVLSKPTDLVDTFERSDNVSFKMQQSAQVFSGISGWYDLNGNKIMVARHCTPTVAGVYLHVADGVATKVIVIK